MRLEGLPQTDGWRRLAAAHELGHYYACRDAGYAVHPPIIRGNGSAVSGFTYSDQVTCKTKEEMLAYIVSHLAGPVAGERWGKQTGEIDQKNYQCRQDIRAVNRAMRELLAEDITRSELRRATERLVNRRWGDITRDVPQLARHGTLR